MATLIDPLLEVLNRELFNLRVRLRGERWEGAPGQQPEGRDGGRHRLGRPDAGAQPHLLPDAAAHLRCHVAFPALSGSDGRSWTGEDT